jgi:hypothetical protein
LFRIFKELLKKIKIFFRYFKDIFLKKIESFFLEF